MSAAVRYSAGRASTALSPRPSSRPALVFRRRRATCPPAAPCLEWWPCLDAPASRGVAQPGSASHWGCGGRWFESSRPDHSTESQLTSMPNPPILISLVQAAPAGQPRGTTALLVGILPWLLIFAIFYMLMIRPQQRRVKEHQNAIAAVKKGDE